MGGAARILFSVLAWRLKNEVFFILSCVTTSLMLIYIIYTFADIADSVRYDPVFFLIHLLFIGLPIFFIVKYFQDKNKIGAPSASLDGAENGGPVTEEFLDDVINSPEEDLDFSDGVDLR
jgi:hypothetical protein